MSYMRHIGGVMKSEEQLMLKESFLFTGMTDAEFRTASALLMSERKEFPRLSLLCSPGETQTSLSFLLYGKASVYRDDSRRVLLRKLGPGDCYGAASLFSADRSYPTEIRAINSVAVLSISETSLRQMFLRFPASATNYISFLSDRIRFLNTRVRDFSSVSAEEKTAKLLLAGTESKQSGIANFRASAESMNLGRASLYRVLNTFAERGWIRKEGKTVTVLEPDKLKGILS